MLQTINFDQAEVLADALGGLTAVAGQAERALGSLDNRLLTLRLNCGKLRAALERAFAPVTSHLADGLNQAVRGVTDFVRDAGAVLGALLGTVQEKAVTTARTTGRALRRSLADFDQLDRLNGSSGSGGTTQTVTWQTVTEPLTPELQVWVDTIRGLLAPLQAISLEGAKKAVKGLGEALRDLGSTVAQGLSWAWFQVLTPLSAWTLETAAPAAVQALTEAFRLLKAMLEPVLEAFRQMEPALAPGLRFLGDTAVLALEGLGSLLEKLAAALTQNGSRLRDFFSGLGQCLGLLWQQAEPVLTGLRSLWAGALDTMGNALAAESAAWIQILAGVAGFLSGAFTGSWKSAWAGIRTVFKGFVNGILGLINAMLSGLVGGVNAAVKALNRFSVTIPGWVPSLGGKVFGFNLKTLSVPQIPYLAQGAVLPANRPFLAVVGDQTSGTNVEAPLSTIQEAVAGVLLPGQEQTNDLLAQLLAAVGSIRVGDAVIGRAAQRYSRRQSILEGGW